MKLPYTLDHSVLPFGLKNIKCKIYCTAIYLSYFLRNRPKLFQNGAEVPVNVPQPKVLSLKCGTVISDNAPVLFLTSCRLPPGHISRRSPLPPTPHCHEPVA
jgi:hypothetical protein